MTECEKEAYQILRNVLWLNEEDHEELYEEFILAVSQALQKKQDEIEKLKNLTHFGYSEVPELKNEIERLKVELNQYQTQTVNVVAFHKLEDEVQRLTARNKELEAENERSDSLRFLNEVNRDKKIKELELILYSHSDDVIRHCYRKIKELEQENQHLANVSVSLNSKIEDFKKSEKAFLETINQQGDEIKELKEDIKVQEDEIEQYIKQWRNAEDCNIKLLKKIEESREVIESLRKALSGRTVSCEACNGMAEKVKELEALLDKKVLSQVKEDREKILELESKIAKAREALKVFAERNPENDPYQPLAKKALAELGEKQ